MIGKISALNHLVSLIEDFLNTNNDAEIQSFLSNNSNLPGPRGNLELANAFANCLAEYSATTAVKLWELCRKMASISVELAPVNTSGEFIPFCGTVGIGSIAAEHSGYFEKALSHLRELARDSRWRMREAVVMALQKLIAANPNAVINELNVWLNDGRLLELRAVAAAVAEPALIENKEVARSALELNRGVVQKLIETEDRKTEDFRVLRKALGYTLSVVIVPLPKEGFEYLRQLIKINDQDINWIIRENLKKNRLIKNFPTKVNSIKSILN